MPKLLRYTGDWPPPEVLRNYPNWVFAYGEEGEEGQDETTLMPQEEQGFITHETQVTAATMYLANGNSLPAVVCLNKGVPVGVNAFEGKWTWGVWHKFGTSLWAPSKSDYLPEHLRPPYVPLSDERVFPLRFVTEVPREPGGQPWRLEIRPDGSITEYS